MNQKVLTERDVEHYLKRLFEDIQDFQDIRSDVPIGSGRADLVVYTEQKPYMIIEVKRQRIDPFDIDVVNQAVGYAVESGAPYFATTNGTHFILFETFKTGVPLMQRRLKVFNVSEKLAKDVLEELTVGVKWLPIDDAFLARLSTLHEVITPGTLEALEQGQKHLVFRKQFEEWVEEQGFAYETQKDKDKTWSIVASQTAYLLVNKIFFYKILETGYPQLPKLTGTTPSNLSSQLRKHFEQVLKIDYRAVFEQGIFDEISITTDVAEALSKFVKELEGYDFSQIKSDVIGRIYERLIPISDRKALGQYYTPPQIVDLILKLTVKNPESKILDPSCGSGGFLVKAYHRLLDLKGKKEAANQKEHQQLLDQLTGIEINQFPAHLSVINLEMQNIKYKSDRINVLVSDFFDVNNIGFENQHKLASLNKTDSKASTYRFFDAVVANPPYIRQEQIKQKQHIQQLMSHYGAKIYKTSDIYSYFFVHASSFLKQGGRLGFITSNKWLEVKYGESLQKFFLDNHKIIAIIEFDAGAFEEALVNTVVVILEKEKDIVKRDSNMVKFVRVKKGVETKELIDTIKSASKPRDDKSLRIAITTQKELRATTKWSLYLRAPAIYHNIIKNLKITTLDKIAQINRGITSGSNEFFYLSKEQVKSWGIEKRFLCPLIKSPRDVKKVILVPEDCDNYVLLVHDSKEKLKGTNVLEYIRYGEEKGFHKLPTVKGRKLWYDLGNKKPSDIIFARKIWMNIICAINTAGAYADQPFYEINPKNASYTSIITSSLLSSITSMAYELEGRSYGGGVLELAVYEASTLPVLNPYLLTKDEQLAVSNALLKCTKTNTYDYSELDKVIFNILGISNSESSDIINAIKDAKKMRSKRVEKEVLVE